MINKVAIVCDSTGCLTEEMLNKYNIFTNYLMIIFGTKSYAEFSEISSTKFLELMEAQVELPSTSQPSPGLTASLYEKILDAGYEEIIHITISSGLSGTYQAARAAAEIVDYDKIYVFDSKTVVFPQGALAILAARLAESGKSAVEIYKRLEEVKEKNQLIAAVKTLENLKKGGRLSNLEAYIGNLLQVKPIITMTEEGKLEAVGKVRTFKKALNHLIDQIKKENLDETYEFAVMHMENLEDATYLKNCLLEIYPNHIVHVLPLSLVISVHVGRGTVGIGWAKLR